MTDEPVPRAAEHVRKFWTWKDQEEMFEVIVPAPGRPVVTGPSVDDFEPADEHNGTVIDLPRRGDFVWRCVCGSGRDLSAPVSWEEAVAELAAHENCAGGSDAEAI